MRTPIFYCFYKQDLAIKQKKIDPANLVMTMLEIKKKVDLNI
jgi:hypothetical protein